jgi:imidazolonepropionase-like amidohydrolase
VAALHLRAVVLPDEVERDLYVVGDRLTYEPVAGAETVFDGGWVIPGLVDAHCHLGMQPDRDGWTPDEESLAAQALVNRDGGALLLRDAGSPVDNSYVQTRDDLPRLLRAGRHISRPKRYIRDLGVEIEPDDLVAEVERQVAYGDGGWVKLVGDWIDRSVGDLAPLWPGDVLTAAVARAHELGARVAVHTFSEDALPDLITAGVDSIEHGTGLTGDWPAEMALRGLALVPTLINIERFPGIAAQADGRYDAYADHMRALHRTATARTMAAHEAGVPIYVGTDAGGGIEHGRVTDEILALHTAGLPAEAALAAGSWAARAWLGIPGLAESAPADLLAYDTDPRADLRVLPHPARVILRGAVIG